MLLRAGVGNQHGLTLIIVLMSSKELDYWMENVDPLIASSSGREYYVRRDNASHDVAKPDKEYYRF